MSAKTPIKFTIKAPQARNPIVIALMQRHGWGGGKIMKHRNTPRGGSRNKQAAYRAGEY
jgi:hypothetical protein